MQPQKVGIREFRENLATYLLNSDAPVAITRHGDTVGYFIPARRKRTEEEKAALRDAVTQMEQILAKIGMTEDEVVEDFKRWRRSKSRNE